MTPDEIARIRADFALIEPRSKEVGLALYTRLFVLDGATRELFKHDLDAQAIHLMDALGAIVAALDDPTAFEEEVVGLAARHGNYGVKREHYASVGEALIATLSATLDDSFTTEARRAWTHAYDTLADAMIEAMRLGDEQRAPRA